MLLPLPNTALLFPQLLPLRQLHCTDRTLVRAFVHRVLEFCGPPFSVEFCKPLLLILRDFLHKTPGAATKCGSGGGSCMYTLRYAFVANCSTYCLRVYTHMYRLLVFVQEAEDRTPRVGSSAVRPRCS
eukprot:GHVS01009398.1.p2 GENE.GHVS01009398.1~~GHVS01009398.1.p2  ORF type:complete len:128 (+),score=17.82 GHVS01009398.1:49-432(+)